MASPVFIRNIAAGLLLAALVFLAFGGALDCGFVRFDDHGYVYENPVVSAGLTKAGIRWAFTTRHMFYWHPLTWLSHMADAEVHGLDPAGHHLTSLLLHALNAILLFAALRGATGRFFPSLLAAALWAVHPLRTESVVWITERKDLLSTFFALLAMGAYGWKPLRGRMAWTAGFFVLALLSKPMWVTLPFLLLLLDAWPLRRWPAASARALAAEKIPLFLLAAVFCGITYFAQQAGGALRPLEGYPAGLRLANAVAAYGQYLRALVWPSGLAAFYPYPVGGVSPWVVGGSLAALLGLTALAFRSARRRPWALAGWLWFLGSLVPMIGLVQTGGQAWADRYSYLPHIGLAVVLAWGAAERAETAAGGRWRRAGVLLAFGLVTGLALLSQRQTATWRDSETLFRHALAVTRDNANIHFNLANGYQQQGRGREAAVHYRETLRIVPGYAPAMNNLAWALASDPAATPEEAQEALSLARRAIEAAGAPDASLLNTLERAQAACGDFAGAAETAREAWALADRAGDAERRDKIRWRMGIYEAKAQEAR